MKRQEIIEKMENSEFIIKLQGQDRPFYGVVLKEACKGYWSIVNIRTREKHFMIPSRAVRVASGFCPNPWYYS